MLVLARKRGDAIVVTSPAGERITIYVLKTRPDKRDEMRLGVDAPKNWPIHRAEIQERIDQEKQQ